MTQTRRPSPMLAGSPPLSSSPAPVFSDGRCSPPRGADQPRNAVSGGWGKAGPCRQIQCTRPATATQKKRRRMAAGSYLSELFPTAGAPAVSGCLPARRRRGAGARPRSRVLRGVDDDLLAPGQQIDRGRDLLDRVVRDHDGAVAVGVDHVVGRDHHAGDADRAAEIDQMDKARATA